jgi:hypothetical protein
MDLMIRLKELQRRMDQILGVPKMNIEVKERCKYTVSARLNRLEDQVILSNGKLDECIHMLKMFTEIKTQLEIQDRKEDQLKILPNQT